MKFLIALSIVLSSNVFAADFTNISKLKSSALNGMAKEFRSVAKRRALVKILTVHGNVNEVKTVSVSWKENMEDLHVAEQNSLILNAVKQYHIKFLGIRSGDQEGKTGEEIVSGNGKDIIDSLLDEEIFRGLETKQLKVMNTAHADLLKALNVNSNNLKQKNLKYYVGNHEFEDGSWTVMDVFDTKTNELLSIKLGYSGT